MEQNQLNKELQENTIITEQKNHQSKKTKKRIAIVMGFCVLIYSGFCLLGINQTIANALTQQKVEPTLPTFDDFQKNYQDMKNESQKKENAEFSATKAEIDTRRQEIENEIAKQKASTSSVQQKSKEIEKEIKETQETIRYVHDEMSSVLDELEDSVQEPGLNEQIVFSLLKGYKSFLFWNYRKEKKTMEYKIISSQGYFNYSSYMMTFFIQVGHNIYEIL